MDKRTPNVLLIVADDMAQRELPNLYGHLWDYGDELPPYTPNIERLAATGTVLERVQSSANCSPTRVSLQTGRYPHRYQIGDLINPPHTTPGLPVVADSVPETFRAAGYRTCLIGKWHLNTHAQFSPFGLQTQAYLDSINANGWDDVIAARHGTIQGGGGGYYDWNRNDNGVLSLEPEYSEKVRCQEAADWIQRQSGPWYMQLGLRAPHKPLHVPPIESTDTIVTAASSDRAKFKAAIESMDFYLGQVLQAVDLSEAIVVFMSDNGTPSDLCHPLADPTKQKKTLYREGIEVPCIVTGVNPGGTRDCIDVPGLLFHIVEDAGVEAPPGWDWPDDESYAYAERFTPNGPGPYTERVQCVRKGDWKLMVTHEPELGGAFYKLFDLLNDPEETAHATNQAKLDELVAIMEEVQA